MYHQPLLIITHPDIITNTTNTTMWHLVKEQKMIMCHQIIAISKTIIILNT